MADATSADDGRFRVDSRVEIVYILRALMKSNALVTAYFNGGREFVVTAVLQVDSEQGLVVLDSGSNRELNERLLHGREVSVVSSQDGVRVQFTTDRVAAVSFEGRLAFRLPLPDTIMKLQRREYYRLATPVVHPLKCEIAGPDGKRFELALADISLGGVCLVGQPASFSFEPGMPLEDCRIDLPEIGAIRAGLSRAQQLRRYTQEQRHQPPDRVRVRQAPPATGGDGPALHHPARARPPRQVCRHSLSETRKRTAKARRRRGAKKGPTARPSWLGRSPPPAR